MAGDGSVWVAAIAAGVVCWQSWETRKAAQASRAAVDVANQGLDLSRQQGAEALRARIDAATPRITVVMPDEPLWPPLEPSLYLGGEPQPITPGLHPDPMLMPRDKGRLILVRTPVTVINESDVHVRVEVSQLTDEKGQPVESPVHLKPHERLEGLFAVTHTLEEWIEAHNIRAAGEPGPSSMGLVLYMDPADTGATDRWELALVGSPVQRVQDIESAWTLLPAPNRLSGRPGAMGLNPALRERSYWLSKSRNQPLPD